MQPNQTTTEAGTLCLNIGNIALEKILGTARIAQLSNRFSGLDNLQPGEDDWILAGPSTAEVMLTGWAAKPLTAEILERFPNLKLVIHGAGSIKGVVTPEAIERNIRFCSAVHVNAQPVAEFCLGVILCDLKRVFRYRGQFEKADNAKEAWWGTHNNFDGGYYHKQVGLIGWGQISRYLAKLLKAFDLDVHVASNYLTPEEEEEYKVSKASIDWIMENCDVVSLHSADVPKNRHQINRENLKLMKPGAGLVNTARGNIIEEEALVEKLREGSIWAYLDVTQNEPPALDHPFYSLPNCVISPHVSGSIGTETLRLGDYCLEELDNYLNGRPLTNEIKTEELGTRA